VWTRGGRAREANAEVEARKGGGRSDQSGGEKDWHAEKRRKLLGKRLVDPPNKKGIDTGDRYDCERIVYREILKKKNREKIEARRWGKLGQSAGGT